MIFSFQYVLVFEVFSFVAPEAVAEVNEIRWWTGKVTQFLVVYVNTMSYLFICQFIWLFPLETFHSYSAY